MPRRYVVMTLEGGQVQAEVLDREEFLKRITPKAPETDTYYGGDYGITFVSSVADLARKNIDVGRGSVLGPMPLLVFEVGEPVKPVQVAVVMRYHLD